jgi:hypothetical protein
MRTRATVSVLAVCAIATAAMAGTAEARTGKAPACLTGGKTEAADSQVRVLVTERTKSDGHSTVATWWACDIAHRKLHVLDSGGTTSNDSRKGIFHPAVNGRFVAYQQGLQSNVEGCTGDIVVFDALRGRVFQVARRPACAFKIVVTAQGDAAWSYFEPFGPTVIAALDRSHGVRELDRDDAVDGTSLQLDGPAAGDPTASVVSWLKGGEHVSAVLE